MQKLLLALFLFCLFSLKPIGDADLFTHLAVGRDIFHTHSLQVNLLSTHIDSTLPANGWLSALLFYLLTALGGLVLLKAANAVLWTLIGLTQLRNVEKFTPALIAAFIFFLIAASSADLRPQVFGFLIFGYVAQQLRYSTVITSKDFVLFFLAGVIWQNLHPASVMLVLVYASFLATSILKKTFYPILVLQLAVLSLGPSFITPLGADFFSQAAYNDTLCRTILKITEWLPPWDPSIRYAVFPFWCVVALMPGIIFLLVKKNRIKEREDIFSVSLVVTTLCASLYATRFVPFFAIAIIPIIVSYIRPYSFPVSSTFLKGSGILLVVVSFLNVFGLTTPLSRFDTKSFQAALGKLASGPVYNAIDSSGLIEFYTKEHLHRPIIDGRLYFFPPERFKDYLSEAKGEVSVEEILNRYSPTSFILHVDDHAELIKRLKGESYEQTGISGDFIFFINKNAAFYPFGIH